jgi:tetratricopeptide (TPR) repeat protein
MYGSLPPEALAITITTDSTNARTLFAQGLMQLWNFNTPEALRNFEASIEEDNNCAMCLWGIAAARGTNINRFVDTEDVKKATAAIQKALRIIAEAAGNGYSALETALVTAQTVRWPDASPSSGEGSGEGEEESTWVSEWTDKGQDHYDEAYAAKMESVVQEHAAITSGVSGDGDLDMALLGALYVESVMNVHRWNYYDYDRQLNEGKSVLDADYTLPQKTIRTVIQPAYSHLQSILGDNYSPAHPLALHLWVHLTEQSHQPQHGEEGADRLAQAMKVGRGVKAGHLIHMPAHTYLRMGAWEKAITSSQRSIEVDQEYAGMCLSPYCPHHNIAVMIHAAMNSGRPMLAKQWAPTHPAHKESHLAAQYIGGLFLTPLEFVYAKFGQWQELRALATTAESVTANAEAALLDRELLETETMTNNREGEEGLGALLLTTSKLRGGGSSDDVASSSSSRLLEGNSGSGTTEAKSSPPKASVPAYLRAISAYGAALTAVHAPIHPETEAAEMLATLEAVVEEIQSDEEAFSIPTHHVFYPFHKEAGTLMVALAAAALQIREGRPATAVTLLEAAAATQDSFQYMEPEHFYTPIRHCLGAALLATSAASGGGGSSDSSQQEQRELLLQAERVFKRDLLEHPRNVWALTGLKSTYMRLLELLRGQKGYDEAEEGRLLGLRRGASEGLLGLQGREFTPQGACCELGLC